jgi:hypothetical protein
MGPIGSLTPNYIIRLEQRTDIAKMAETSDN